MANRKKTTKMLGPKKPNPKPKLVKPPPGFLDKFKSKRPPNIAGVETLLTPLPVMRIAEANDFTRLHPDEDNYWSCELCFVSVPIDGEKRDMLHLIDEDIAVQYLPSKKIKRQRLALASKPDDKFFLCIVPSQNLDNSWNATALTACEKAKTSGCRRPRARRRASTATRSTARDQDAFADPKWPTRTLEELIEVTFQDAMIETDDHPGLLRLIGGKQNLA